MVLYMMTCDNCGETRTGWKKEDGITPLQDDCQNCGATDFTPPESALSD
jgi:predicted nucleic-acid-binding Zn-ribbon protein